LPSGAIIENFAFFCNHNFNSRDLNDTERTAVAIDPARAASKELFLVTNTSLFSVNRTPRTPNKDDNSFEQRQQVHMARVLYSAYNGLQGDGSGFVY
jgi:hypothetical protein